MILSFLTAALLSLGAQGGVERGLMDVEQIPDPQDILLAVLTKTGQKSIDRANHCIRDLLSLPIPQQRAALRSYLKLSAYWYERMHGDFRSFATTPWSIAKLDLLCIAENQETPLENIIVYPFLAPAKRLPGLQVPAAWHQPPTEGPAVLRAMYGDEEAQRARELVDRGVFDWPVKHAGSTAQHAQSGATKDKSTIAQQQSDGTEVSYVSQPDNMKRSELASGSLTTLVWDGQKRQ